MPFGLSCGAPMSRKRPPDGQIGEPHVQPLPQKYSGVLFPQITSTTLAIPARTEGRFAIVTNVGLGCDGRERRC